jgi:hypothetical protein
MDEILGFNNKAAECLWFWGMMRIEIISWLK